MKKYYGKTVDYWKQNAEEDYINTPISVLKYITVLEEQSGQFRKHSFSSLSKQLIANEKDAFDREYTKGWVEGFNS